ncbi:hypothetical protein ACMHYB_39890 [Sorangium sp. So ce1128]
MYPGVPTIAPGAVRLRSIRRSRAMPKSSSVARSTAPPTSIRLLGFMSR